MREGGGRQKDSKEGNHTDTDRHLPKRRQDSVSVEKSSPLLTKGETTEEGDPSQEECYVFSPFKFRERHNFPLIFPPPSIFLPEIWEKTKIDKMMD